VVTEAIAELCLTGGLSQHPPVQLGPQAGHSLLDVRSADRRQVEERCSHRLIPFGS
jgi:hypothetical protein